MLLKSISFVTNCDTLNTVRWRRGWQRRFNSWPYKNTEGQIDPCEAWAENEASFVFMGKMGELTLGRGHFLDIYTYI